MTFVPFALVEWQSQHEPGVPYSLADSGCQAIAIRELATGDTATGLFDLDQHYPVVCGSDELRDLAADWHGADRTNILVTVGGTEANAITIATLVEPGDHVVVMQPGYGQVPGCALNRGAKVDVLALDPADGWRPDLDALARMVGPHTKAIAVTNPSNPVGTVLTEDEMAAIVSAADRVGAWILTDEVHRGTELFTDDVTPTFWNRYDRVVCVGSLSKAFGLPGLRTGWLVAPPELVRQTWRRHDYATIATATLSMRLAEIALSPGTRERLLARSRGLIRAGHRRLRNWIAASDGLLSIVPPQATALGFVRYHLDRPSVEIAEALRVRGGVLVAPGAHFGFDGHIRVTHGLEPGYVTSALDRIAAVLRQIREENDESEESNERR